MIKTKSATNDSEHAVFAAAEKILQLGFTPLIFASFLPNSDREY